MTGRAVGVLAVLCMAAMALLSLAALVRLPLGDLVPMDVGLAEEARWSALAKVALSLPVFALVATAVLALLAAAEPPGTDGERNRARYARIWLAGTMVLLALHTWFVLPVLVDLPAP